MKGILLASSILLGLAAQMASAAGADVRLFVRHDVSDYTAWRAAYDGFDAKRRSMGVTAAAVYQSVGNPNNVTVWHDFKSADSAKAFASSPDLKAVMTKAGVIGRPQIWFAIKADK